MAGLIPHPPEVRRAAEALLRDTDLTMTEIAARTGVRYGTIRNWNRAARLRVSVRAGISAHLRAPRLRRLDAALYAHVRRQIAVLDARLRRAPDSVDSTRALRDLVGLKRLIDDLAGRRGRKPRETAKEKAQQGDADGEPRQDLAALRADIARRYEAFEAAWTDRAVPGEPDAGSAGGAGG